MHPIREEEDDVFARLEARLELVNGVMARLKERNAELGTQLREAISARDAAIAEADEAKAQAARVVEEADSLRSRQKQAASRIKNLLSQMEQLDLQSEN